jgi:hypothetical protein
VALEAVAMVETDHQVLLEQYQLAVAVAAAITVGHGTQEMQAVQVSLFSNGHNVVKIQHT